MNGAPTISATRMSVMRSSDGLRAGVDPVEGVFRSVAFIDGLVLVVTVGRPSLCRRAAVCGAAEAVVDGSCGVQRHFGLAVEQVHAVLVELDPDLLVGRDRRRSAATLTIDDGARDEDLDEGDVAGRLDGIDLARHGAGHRASCAA